MSEDIPQAAIKKVQDSLSLYIKKPPLSEKLLSKPPFRYIHDIVNSVIRETGFLRDVYTPKELDSNNVKDKASKISFLEKLISAVSDVTGRKISARPSKIVAGLDVLNTLSLLQEIGLAIDAQSGNSPRRPEEQNLNNHEQMKKLNSELKNNRENIAQSKAEVVDLKNDPASKIRTSLEKNNSVINNTDQNKLSSRQNVKERGKEVNAPDKRNGIAEKKGTSTKQVLVSQNKTSGPTVTKEKSQKIPLNSSVSTLRTKKVELETESKKIKKGLQTTIAEKKNNMLLKPEDINEKKKVHGNSLKIEDKVEVKLDEPNATRKNSKIKENGNDRNEELPSLVNSMKESDPKITQRPGSARPGSRKVVHSVEEDTSSPTSIEKNSTTEIKNQALSRLKTGSARPPSARPGAPRVHDRGEVTATDVELPVNNNSINLIEEGSKEHMENDNDSFITIESKNTNPLLVEDELTKIKGDEQGQLVHQILKTQKDLNDSVAGDSSQNKHVDIEWEAGREREKDIVSKEVEEIRNAIQRLTSAANPLGKLFDFLQEDVDEMQRELQYWRNENEKLYKQQQNELQLQNSSLEPLRKQLLNVENTIQEENELICNIKLVILNNDAHIHKLVTSTKK